MRVSSLVFLVGGTFVGTILAEAVQADDIRQIALISNDIAYSPATKQIYASIPGSAGVVGNGNSLTAIEPESGTVGASVFVGSEPDQLAVSDDGQFVYIGLDGQSSVGRFDTATGVEGLKFSLGSPLSVDDMTVLPGFPHTLIVSKQDRRFSPRTAGTYVYDDGVGRPN
jgi:DNA-binding beta-propeller fold protein YncE